MDALIDELAAQDPIPLSLLMDLGRRPWRQYFDGNDISDKALGRLVQILTLTVCSHSVVDAHLTAACNLLCVVIKTISTSKPSKVGNFAYSQEVWTAAWTAIHRAFSEGKPKPALQVIDTLIKINSTNPDQTSASKLLRGTISKIITILIRGEPQPQLKEACTILHVLLQKHPGNVLWSYYLDCVNASLRRIFQGRCLKCNIGATHFDAMQQSPQQIIFLAVLLTAQSREPRPAALKLFSYLCSCTGKHDYSGNIGAASQMMQIYLNTNSTASVGFSNVLFPAVVVDEAQFFMFVEHHNPRLDLSDNALEIFLRLLEVGRERAFISERSVPELLIDSVQSRSEGISTEDSTFFAFDGLLSSLQPRIRLIAFKLLTMSPSTNLPVSTNVLNCLTRNISILHNESDAYYRDEFVSIIRAFLQRLVRSGVALRKPILTGPDPIHDADSQDPYATFLGHYFALLVSELGPHVSYPRHILALQVLRHIIDLRNLQSFHLPWPTVLKTLIDPLLSLLLDPFDDVRNTASAILQHVTSLFPTLLPFSHLVRLLHLMQLQAASTNRADHADALGRLYLLNGVTALSSDLAGLVPRPDVGTSAALRNLLSETNEYLSLLTALSPQGGFPLHGKVLGVAYLADSGVAMDTDLALKLYKMCLRIWELVYTELCVDTPEKTTESDEYGGHSGPKDLLSYSWRALRDSSLVIQAALQKLPAESSMKFHDDFGSLCLEQLIKLRHRGAFSTVAQTFAACCNNVWRIGKTDSKASYLIEKWQHIAFLELEIQGSKLTRRSAGIPAIFSGLLDVTDAQHFSSVIGRLSTIAFVNPEVDLQNTDTGELRLPQVHALNCLKDIMTNSKFRILSESLVTRMSALATHSMGSEVWAIRNCGLMLLRACINRINAENLESDERVHLPNLKADDETPLKMAVRLLEDVHQGLNDQDFRVGRLSEHIFAALDLLGRLEVSTGSKALVNGFFEREMRNPIWAVREHAAMLRAAAVDAGDEVNSIRSMLALGAAQLSQNEIHGRLLCCRYILSSALGNELNPLDLENTLQVVTALNDFIEEQLSVRQSSLAMGTCLDILNDIYRISIGENVIGDVLDGPSSKLVDATSERYLQLFNPALQRSRVLNVLYRCLRVRPHHLLPTSDKEARVGSSHELKSWLFSDPDALSYALQKIESATVSFAETIDIHMWLALHSSFDDIRAGSMLALASHIQCSLNMLSSKDLQLLDKSIKLDRTCSRVVLDAEIALSASIIEYFFNEGSREATAKLQRLLNIIQLCLLDEVELSSRLNAAFALGTMSVLVTDHDDDVAIATTEDRIRIIVMMRTLLNDDDEEIRETTAGFVHSMIQRAGLDVQKVAPCALVAREKLLALLQELFGGSTQLAAVATARVLGASPSIAVGEVENLVTYMARTPVVNQVEAAVRRATDLFAEEKQNLYLDSIAEVREWSCYVDLKRLDEFKSTITPRLLKWTQDGVLCLTALLKGQFLSQMPLEGQSEAHFGLLGATYNEEILVISLRVATIAGLLLKMHANPGQKAIDNLESLRQALAVFQKVCQESKTHDMLLETLQAAASSEQ